ncbi:MAG: tetratricopeptide repeat-containing protein kinase family protein, partial [Pseudomonadota bacterium]
AEGALTLTGVRPMTPQYAAPEQLLGDSTTTATDVYSLGLILFELLSGGRSAFGEEGTSSPEVMQKRLAGQLDVSGRRLVRAKGIAAADRKLLLSILNTTLRRQPEQRYASMGALADDLEALLSGKAVSARPLGPVRAMLRWARFHRLSAVLGLLALVATLSGTAFSLWFAHQAGEERMLALREAQRAEQTAAFLENLFVSASPGEAGPNVTARSLLGLGQQRLQAELADQPALVAHLEAVIGRSYLNLGLFDEALAITEHDALPTSSERALLGARALIRLGRFADALPWLDQAFPDAADTSALIDLALLRSTVSINLDDIEEADRQANLALRLAQGDPSTADQRVTAQSMLAAVAFNREDFDAALAAYEGILDIRIEIYGPRDRRTAQAHHNVGSVAFMHGELDTAIGHYREAIGIYREAFGEDNRSVGMSLRSLGLSLRRSGRGSDARSVLEETVDVLANWETADSPVYREASLQLAELYWLLGEPDAVRTLLEPLPEVDEPQAETAKQVECRLQLMGRLIDESSRLPACLMNHEMPDSVQAFVAYAELILRSQAGQANLGLVDEAMVRIESLNPPDPLLLEAILGLKSDYLSRS